MPNSRRRFISSVPTLLGGAAVLAACSSTADPEGYDAVAAQTWRTAELAEPADISAAALRLELVRFATLAPSSHNTQCWQFALADHAITLLPDLARRFPAVIVGAGSSLGRTLAAVAKVGTCTAPLPRALLGRSKPLRAFIGHVEPTFDWTLRDPATGQVTTHHIVDTLYNQLHLFSRPPIGLAMSVYFRAVAGLLQDHLDAVDGVDQHQPNALERARRAKLFALDRLAMVLLGDPTVSLPHRLSAIHA